MKITGVDYEGGKRVAVYIEASDGRQKFTAVRKPTKMELAEIISRESLFYNTPGDAICLAGNLLNCGVVLAGCAT